MHQTRTQPAVWSDQARQAFVRSPIAIGMLAVGIGGAVGAAAAFGPIYVAVGLLALAVGYAFLISTTVGLVSAFAIITLLPFGTLPFKAIITPNFLTLALVALLGVWVLRLLARSDAYDLRLTPLGLPLLGFLGLTLFSLVLGARGLPDSLTLHNYAKFVLGVLFYISIVNVVRTRAEARFALQTLIICGALGALLGLALYALNDTLALRLLVSLGRIGYPTEGRVLRYVEDDVSGLERAIGTSVDPNSFGGMLALIGALTAAQLFAQRPVLPRPVLIGAVGVLVVALLLTFSRAALFGIIIATAYLATLRYHRLWWVMIAVGTFAAILLVVLGIGADFAQRVVEGVQFQDQAQQMRLAEFQNAFNIIQRYPWFGIGFGQAPDIDLTAGVSNIYLAIAQRMGLLGLVAFLALITAWFVLSLRGLSRLNSERSTWVLGAQSGLVAALAVGMADHYFFNIEFSHMVALFWGCAGVGAAIIELPDAN